MEISFTEKDLEFRDEIKSWIEHDYPQHIKNKQEKGEALTKEEVRSPNYKVDDYCPYCVQENRKKSI